MKCSLKLWNRKCWCPAQAATVDFQLKPLTIFNLFTLKVAKSHPLFWLVLYILIFSVYEFIIPFIPAKYSELLKINKSSIATRNLSNFLLLIKSTLICKKKKIVCQTAFRKINTVNQTIWKNRKKIVCNY